MNPMNASNEEVERLREVIEENGMAMSLMESDNYALTEQVRLLIEEREQIIKERDEAWKDVRGLSALLDTREKQVQEWHQEVVSESLRADIAQSKVAERDKEIQSLKDQNTILDDKLNELESSFDTCTRCSLTIVHK